MTNREALERIGNTATQVIINGTSMNVRTFKRKEYAVLEKLVEKEEER